MTLFYYKDGDEDVKGPFDESIVLDRYSNAEFTSDVEFQIRSSETDTAAPFISLFHLIRVNGHRNPFRHVNEDLERMIEQRKQELDELSATLAKKPMLEKRLADLEKKMEERMKQRGTNTQKSDISANDGGMAFRRQKHIEADGKITFPSCSDCPLVFSSHKQLMLHTSRSSCTYKDSTEFAPDFERWKKEDEQRLAAGQRIFKRMTSNEVGSSRPQIDFVEELHSRISNKMVFEYDGEGKDIARTWVKTEEAKKVSDRFIKHLKEASGHLVCTRCQVACRSYDHFIIHLITYDHRLKVKGSPIESLSLLVGNFHKEKYLDLPEASELDEDVEMALHTSCIPLSAATVLLSTSVPTTIEEFDEEKSAAMKQQFIMEWTDDKTLICNLCDLVFATYKQWVMHATTEEHEEKCGAQMKESSAIIEKLFSAELQKWRWEDRVKLAIGKRLFESMNDTERMEARPSESFTAYLMKCMEEIYEDLEPVVRSVGYGNDKTETMCLIAKQLEGAEEAKMILKTLDEHLNMATLKRFVCRPCKVAFDSTEKFYVHYQMSRHLLNMVTRQEKLFTTLISFHKKDLYI